MSKASVSSAGSVEALDSDSTGKLRLLNPIFMVVFHELARAPMAAFQGPVQTSVCPAKVPRRTNCRPVADEGKAWDSKTMVLLSIQEIKSTTSQPSKLTVSPAASPKQTA